MNNIQEKTILDKIQKILLKNKTNNSNTYNNTNQIIYGNKLKKYKEKINEITEKNIILEQKYLKILKEYKLLEHKNELNNNKTYNFNNKIFIDICNSLNEMNNLSKINKNLSLELTKLIK